MKTIGIVTARGGSKGIKDKNIKMFAGKPLIAWTVEAAMRSHMLDITIVSTDSWEIADICKRAGAVVPFIRDESLAKDDTPHIDVVLDAIRQVGYEEFTHCCLLQPTSPLRTSIDIDEACIMAAKYYGASVISVTANTKYPYVVKKNIFGRLRIPLPIHKYLPRQKIKNRFYINGAIYVNPVPMLQKRKSFYAGPVYPYIMPADRAVQIDSQTDFDIAECLMEKRQEELNMLPTITVAPGIKIQKDMSL